MPWLNRNLIGFLHVWIFATFLTATSLVSAGTSDVTVFVLEPTTNGIGYSISRGNTNVDTTESILNELMRNYSRGDRIVLLFHPDVPIRAITTVRSLASKVGYTVEEMRLFAFDKKRRGMIEVLSDNEFVKYSADPADLSAYFIKRGQ